LRKEENPPHLYRDESQAMHNLRGEASEKPMLKHVRFLHQTFI